MTEKAKKTPEEEEMDAIVEGQGSLFNYNKTCQWSNPACWFKYLRYLNFTTLLIFTFIFLGVHMHSVRKGTVCSAYNTPTKCVTDGGYFKAMNFTVLTTRLSYQSPVLVSGSYKVLDNSMSVRSVDPFPVLFYPDGPTGMTTQYTASVNCPTITNATASYGASDGPRSRKRCDAELMQQIFQVPNSRTDRSVSGGLHTWFMFYVSLHIATAFAAILLPDSPKLTAKTNSTGDKHEWQVDGEMEWFKAVFVFIWYIFGFLSIILLFADSDDNNMRIPVNNIILSLIIEVFAAIITFVWVFTDLYPYCMEEIKIGAIKRHETEIVKEINESENMSSHGSHTVHGEIVWTGDDSEGFKGASQLTNLMRIQTPNVIPQGPMNPMMATPMMMSPVMSPWQQHGPAYTPLGFKMKRSTTHTHLDRTVRNNKFDFSVFDVKVLTGEIIEPFLVECALTMPIILAVTYGIGHQNTYDFVIQSIFVRTFIGFAILAVCVKVFGIWHCGEKKRKNDKQLIYISAAAGAVCVITAFAVTVMFAFMLYTWFNPLHIVAVENHKIGHMPYAHSFVLVVLILTITIISSVLLSVVVNSVSLVFKEHVASVNMNMGILFTVTLLLWALRFIMFIYMFFPDWLLGAFDNRDVIFGYPY